MLINNTLSSLTLFSASVFIFPSWVIKAIDRTRTNFLWHQGEDVSSRAKILVSWSIICRSKLHVGLGILNLKIFNFALVYRWWWIWLTKPVLPWHLGLIVVSFILKASDWMILEKLFEGAQFLFLRAHNWCRNSQQIFVLVCEMGRWVCAE